MFKKVIKVIAALFVTSLLLIGLASLSHFQVGKKADGSLLRLGWRATDNKLKICREYTETEKATILKHMQLGEICENHIVTYHLVVTIDGVIAVSHDVVAGGARSDHPLIVSEDIRVAPGQHRVEIVYSPDENPVYLTQLSEKNEKALNALGSLKTYRTDEKMEFKNGRIILVDLDEAAQTFVWNGR